MVDFPLVFLPGHGTHLTAAKVVVVCADQDILLRSVGVGGREEGDDVAVGLLEVLEGGLEFDAVAGDFKASLGMRVFFVEGALDGF